MFRLESPILEPVHHFHGVTAASRGRGVLHASIPVLSGIASLPDELDALVLCSDLQFMDTDEAPVALRRPLGQVVAERLGALGDAGLLPDPLRTGAILAGDMYSLPDLSRRGGSGDVSEVWQSFAGQFAWVAGVAGNHDTFPGGLRPFSRGTRHLLDGTAVTLSGLRVAGVSGVVGDPRKLWRRTPEDFAEKLRAALARRPHILALHESVTPPDRSRIGRDGLMEIIADSGQRPLVVTGHMHWSDPLVAIPGGPTLLNVDARVVILARHRLDPW